MRKLQILFMILFALAGGLFLLPRHTSAAPLGAFTLADVRQRVDSWLANQWQTIQQRESEFYNLNGYYWQGLKTHLIEPSWTASKDGSSLPDSLDSSPEDQPVNWLALFPALAQVSIPAALQIDTYAGPEGMGYVATVWVKWNDRIYSRSVQYGPETWRDQGWHEVTPLP